MNPFILRKGLSKELDPFAHILEFGARKIQQIRLDSLPVEKSDHFSLFYVWDGRFEWQIDGREYLLFPTDLALVTPGGSFGNTRQILDIGVFSHLTLEIDPVTPFAPWTSLTPVEGRAVANLILHNETPVISGIRPLGLIFQSLANEFREQELGYQTRIRNLIDSLLILTARQLIRQTHSQRDFPRTFMRLEQQLRANLAHQWTVEEMAAVVGLGTTTFTEKVKAYTGFPPLAYLINIRISESIRLLKRTDWPLTGIALETGFYSSQHFSTTFRKLTGYTPSQFRKNNTDTI